MTDQLNTGYRYGVIVTDVLLLTLLIFFRSKVKIGLVEAKKAGRVSDSPVRDIVQINS